MQTEFLCAILTSSWESLMWILVGYSFWIYKAHCFDKFYFICGD